jgi:hypothetical protein
MILRNLLRNHLHVLTCVVLPLMIAAALWTVAVEQKYSRAQGRRVQIGLPERVIHVSIAMGISTTPQQFKSIFDDLNGKVEDSLSDRTIASESLRRDYALIAAYTLLLTLLGFRTWLPGSTCPRWLRVVLVVLPLFVGLFDAAENLGARSSLAAYPALETCTLRWTAAASWAKWTLSFIEMTLLGWAMLGLDRQRVIGALLRELAGLILLTAGLTGIWGFCYPSILPSTFVFGLCALLPIGLMLFFRDHLWHEPFRLSQLLRGPGPGSTTPPPAPIPARRASRAGSPSKSRRRADRPPRRS